MALDKLVDSTQLDGALTATANALRTKGGTSASIEWDATNGFKAAVEALPSGTAAISVVDTTDTHGGTIREITALDISDTTAVAADVASGKYFYTADGTKTAGTASGGGGGLVYETGTYTPASDIAHPEISFANAHETPPIIYMIADVTGTYNSTDYTNYLCCFIDYYGLFNKGIYENSSKIRYATASGIYRSSNATAFGSNATGITSLPTITGTGSTYYNYWVSNTGIIPCTASTTRYFRSGRTYKWIAVWAPTT